jgi:hypothetical protein
VKAQTYRLNLTARGVMTLYIKDDVDRAIQLLPYWEDNQPVAHELLGTDWVKLLIWDLRVPQQHWLSQADPARLD